MTDFLPPLSLPASRLPPAGVVGSSLANLAVTLQSLPDKITALTRPLSLTGTLLSAIGDKAALTVRTALGDITLRLLTVPNEAAGPLKEQLAAFLANATLRPITLLIQPGQPPTEAVLLLPSALIVSKERRAQESGHAFAAPPALKAGSTLTAILLPHVGDKALTAFQTAPMFSFLETVENTAAFGLSHAAALNFRILSLHPPNVAVSPGSHEILATVIEQGKDGHLVLESQGAQFFVRQAGDAPVGTQILLVPQDQSDAALTVRPAFDSPTLRALVEALGQSLGPSLAARLIETHIPQPNAALPSHLLFLLSALQQGDVRPWLSPAITEPLARANKAHILTQFLEAMDQASGLARDAVVGEWRSYPLPLHSQWHFCLVPFYVHQDPRNARNAKGGGASSDSKTRFLINLALSRLGALQIDGLAQTKKLDMIIRSENALPEPLPQELQALYTNALETMGLTGTLRFQTGRHSWLIIQPAATRSGVVT